jgi:hypothetical protein
MEANDSSKCPFLNEKAKQNNKMLAAVALKTVTGGPTS